jgi:hypothetical protein
MVVGESKRGSVLRSMTRPAVPLAFSRTTATSWVTGYSVPIVFAPIVLWSVVVSHLTALAPGGRFDARTGV